MASNPELIEIPQLPPMAPTVIKCPEGYIKHKSICFKFGSHSSYEMAKSSCESVGARLANIVPSFSKYVRDQVRTMGGNDFWIGSFINRGRTYRQKGRTSCPIMRGQMINDALYELVNCNSANRYICQKYGPVETHQLGPELNPFGGGFAADGRPNLPPTVKPTTTTKVSEDADGGGMSPVIYVVITVIILIVAVVALKILIGKYFRERKKKLSKSEKVDKSIKKEKQQEGKVFTPKWRNNKNQSKTSSIDSAVPPSNPSSSPGKSQSDQNNHLQKESKIREETRMGRPRVNGPQPTRKPPHMNGDFLCSYHGPSMDKHIYDREPRPRRHRRTSSDPRSDYFEDTDVRRHSRRRSYYSDYSDSTSESDSDDSRYSGHRYGPTKVYQRHTSQSQMRREPLHYHIDAGYYGLPRRDYHSRDARQHRGSRGRHKSNNGNVYYDDGRRERSRYTSHKEADYGYRGNNADIHGGRRQGNMPTVSAKVDEKQAFEQQYFPQPHRLMSWTTPGELNELSLSAEPLVQNTARSFPREPIRVSRQIHQQPKKSKKAKAPAKSEDGTHTYESLDEVKRNKQLKKASQRNKSRKKRGDRQIKRGSESRTSIRSVASIQSRRLPTPPT